MKHGFSLLELSIVLVIIALLAGGIVVGQSLIRSAQIRSIDHQVKDYLTAVSSFKDRYRALPGDMPNATQFWGRADGGTNTGQNCAAPLTNTAGQGNPATCNGDGDGRIIFEPVAGSEHEAFRFWQHLANAGLIEGSFTGVSGPGGDFHSVLGVNSPESRLSGVGFHVRYHDPTGPSVPPPNSFWFPSANLLRVGAQKNDDDPGNPFLTVQEAYVYDTKFDDGLPAQGNIRHRRINDNCTDATSNTDYDAEYDLSTESVACALAYYDPF